MRPETVIPVSGLPADYKQTLAGFGFEVGEHTDRPPAEPVECLQREYGRKVGIDGFLACSPEERRTFSESPPDGIAYKRTPCNFLQATLPENWSSEWKVLSMERGTSVSWSEPYLIVHMLKDDKGVARLRCNYDLATDRSVERTDEAGRKRNPFYAIPSVSPKFNFFVYAPRIATLSDCGDIQHGYEDATEVASLRTYNERLSKEQNEQLSENYAKTATAIVRQALPELEQTLAYWNTDNGPAIADIRHKFAGVEKRYYEDYAASAHAQPRFDFQNYDYALFFRDSEFKQPDLYARVDAPRGYRQSENPKAFQEIEGNCRKIAKQFLPEIDNPSAYWGQDCNEAVKQIESRFRQYDQGIRLSAEKSATPSFKLPNARSSQQISADSKAR